MLKKLNGLPNNIIASFFGTARTTKDTFVSRYYDGGYMVDWLSNAAQKYKILTATFDIKNATATPFEFNIYPLIYNIQDLNAVISNELVANSISPDFIQEARLEVSFSPDSRILQAKSVVIDKDGTLYQSNLYSEQALEPYFDVEEKMKSNE